MENLIGHRLEYVADKTQGDVLKEYQEVKKKSSVFDQKIAETMSRIKNAQVAAGVNKIIPSSTSSGTSGVRGREKPAYMYKKHSFLKQLKQ